MRILDKYFLREFLRPLAYCTGAFLLCWFVYDLLDHFSDFFEWSNFMKIPEYYLIILPSWLVQIMPITLLLALLYTLADLSKSGELIAMRATGMDLYRLMIPIFVLAGVITVVMLVLNVTWAPIAQKKANELMLSLKKNSKSAKGNSFNVFYKSLQANRSWYIEQFDFDANEATNIDMVESDNEGRDLKKYIAARGTFGNGHWKFYDVLIYNMQKKESDPGATHRVAHLELPDCKDNPEKFQMKHQKPARMSSRDISVSLHLDKGMPRQRRAQYLTELYYRFAFPFSNLVVLLIGLPFGITPHRRSAFLAISNALLIFFAYQVTTQICLVLGNNDQIPAMVAGWFPNVAFGALGVYLIRNVR